MKNNDEPFFGNHHTVILDLNKEDDRNRYDELMTKQGQGKIMVHRDQVEKVQNKDTNEIRFVALVQYYEINISTDHPVDADDIAAGIPNPSKEFLANLKREPNVPVFNIEEL